MALFKKSLALLAGLNGACAVVAGAYAAHGMKGSDPYLLDLMDKATHYQGLHAVAVLAVLSIFAQGSQARVRWGLAAAAAMTVGMVLFCGALYGIALKQWLIGGVAPAGGFSLIAGWLAVAAAALCRESAE